MVRIDVETMVWSRAPRNMPIISPVMMVRICRWVYSPDSDWVAVADWWAGVVIARHHNGCPRQLLNSHAPSMSSVFGKVGCWVVRPGLVG